MHDKSKNCCFEPNKIKERRVKKENIYIRIENNFFRIHRIKLQFFVFLNDI